VAELALRTPTIEDAGAIAELCNVLTQELYADADVDAHGVAQWFAMPEIGLFLAERAGKAVGYADVRRDDEGGRFPIDVRVHPDARGAGVADTLVAATEEWARGGARPDALVRAFVAERDAECREAVERRGYRLIRHSFNMEIDLPEVPELPDWPEGVSVRTYDPERDEEVVYACTAESFADHWDFRPIPLERWRAFNTADPRFDPTLWWLVEDGDDLAAVCLNHWHFSGDPAFGWVGTLGVRRPWRRQGLGLALLRLSFVDFARRGAVRVGLGVDAENTTGAVRLYERAGMRPVRRHDTYERAL
jgi:mycothiol synthase